MNKKLLSVSLERFLAEKKLAREIFLNLSTNGKMIRLAFIGDSISQPLLQRLRQKGITALYVLQAIDDLDEPEKIQLYLENPTNETALSAENKIATAGQHSIDKRSEATEISEDQTSPNALNNSAEEQLSATNIARDLNHSAEQTLVTATQEKNSEQIFNKDESIEETQNFSPEREEPIETQTPFEQTNEIDSAKKFSRGVEEEEETQQFSADLKNPVEIKKIAGKSSISNEETAAFSTESEAEKESKRIAGKLEEPEDSNRFSADSNTPVEIRKITGGSSNSSEETTVFSAESKTEKDPDLKIRKLDEPEDLQRLSEDSIENPGFKKSEDHIKEVDSPQSSSSLLERNEKPAGLAGLSALIKAKAKSSNVSLSESDILIVKGTPEPAEIERRITSLRAALDDAARFTAKAMQDSPSEALLSLKEDIEICSIFFKDACRKNDDNAVSKAASSLEEAIQSFEARAHELDQAISIPIQEIMELTVRRFTSAAETTAVENTKFAQDKNETENFFIQDTEGEAKKTSSMDQNFVKEQPSMERNISVNGRAATFKDLPGTAGRLSTYLAHALGYVSQDFLSDLALGVILYFSGEDEKKLGENDLPSLIQAILKRQHSSVDATVEDALEIVALLEIYFKNPDCDRTERNFTQKVFENTLSELKQSPSGLNVWNEIRWTQLVAKGTSVSALSSCSKAAAKAIRSSKEMGL